jgi:hypothetical protein
MNSCGGKCSVFCHLAVHYDFENINWTLNEDLLYDTKPAMKNKYSPLQPWPCENMVFRWISVFWVHTETVICIAHSNIVWTFIVHCGRQSVLCSHLSLSLNNMETKYGTVCTYETVLMTSSDNKPFQSVTFQTSTYMVLWIDVIHCCLLALG